MRLFQRIAKLFLAKDQSFRKCMGEGCSKAPEVECIWAGGRGRAWHCQKCHDKWVRENENAKGEDALPLEIVKQHKVPNGVVGETFGKYPNKKNAIALRVASRYLAKATGVKEWGGKDVGLFIPLPKGLAKQFPSLGEDDTSPSHVTFLYIGDVKGEEQQNHLLNVLKDVHGKWWREVTGTLGPLAYFEQPDKDRRVAHVQVDFDKDLSGMRHRVKQALLDGGIPVEDNFPEYKPHVTLAYMPGIDHPDWDGVVPQGSWTFEGLEVWGLPEVHEIEFRPSSLKVAHEWIRLKGARTLFGGVHDRNIALMKWLSAITQKLGVAKDTYVVGGAVRNFLIDQPIKDLDIVIDSVRAGKDSDWLAKQIAKAIPAMTNVTTNQYGVAILTVKSDWVLEGENLVGEVIEIANARKESYGGSGGKGYKPSEVEPATIEEDVVRREFSFNTLLWRLLDLTNGPEKAEVIDLTGCGLKDLREGILSCPSDPDQTFSDDPTRILRAIKFTGKYGFKIPHDLAQAIHRNAPKMKRMPWEAIATILVGNVLNEPTARKSLLQMKGLGILDVLSEMIQEQKPFATFMANQLRSNRKIQLLLDLMELGVPVSTPISFLDPHGQQRLRELTVRMPREWAEDFVESLIKPMVDNARVIKELDLAAVDRRHIQPTARNLILVDPRLVHDPDRLTDRVIQMLEKQTRTARSFPSAKTKNIERSDLRKIPFRSDRLASLTKRSDSDNWGQLYGEFETIAVAVPAIVKAVEDAARSGIISDALVADDGVFRVFRYGGQKSAYKYISQRYGGALINRGRAWTKYIIQNKAVPKAKVKGLEQAAKLFLGAKQVPGEIQTWVHRNERNLEFLLNAKSWPKKAEDSDDLYKVDTFIVHNTLKLDSEELAKTNKVIEASVKFLKRSGIPHVNKVLYGDLFIVGKLLGHDTLAWYNVGDDHVYLRPMLKADANVVHNLTHELGHRYWYKVLPTGAQAAWKKYHTGKRLEFPEVKDQVEEIMKSIRVGDPFPVPVTGLKRGGGPIVLAIEKDGNDLVYVLGQKGGGDVRKRIRARALWDFLRKEKSVAVSFPTTYAATSPEEHFAESFALYALGKLTGVHKENFEKLVINS